MIRRPMLVKFAFIVAVGFALLSSAHAIALEPPKGAVIKSHGAERLGDYSPRGYKVCIKEMNASKPLIACPDSFGKVSRM